MTVGHFTYELWWMKFFGKEQNRTDQNIAVTTAQCMYMGQGHSMTSSSVHARMCSGWRRIWIPQS